MNNNWKPEKNISSPWDVDVWENNIGQTVSDAYIPPIGTSHIYSKWYDVDTTKITSIKDVQALVSALGLKISETNENFDEVKHLLDIPEKPKTLEQISQELDEKIDVLTARTIGKFEYSKESAEKRYNTKFDKIFENFEYAKKNGNFPLKITINCDGNISLGTSYPSAKLEITSNFVIKQGSIHTGYYTIGNQRYLRYYMPDKPNVVVRFFMDKLLGFKWIDEK